MKTLAKTFFFVAAIILLAVGVFPVAAQVATLNPTDCTTLGLNCPGGTGAKPLFNFISKIVNWFLGFVGLLAAIMLIWGGIKYIISLGDEQEAETAKKLILYAIIGLLVIGIAAAVVNFVLFAINNASK